MTFNIPKNQTILVFANYRTGSTAFCNWLSRTTGLTNYDEAFHPIPSVRKTVDLAKQCIIKIMPDHAVPVEFNALVEKSFVIGMQRKNLVEQIASFYICGNTHRWHQNKGQQVQDYTVNVDDSEIENQIRYILDMQRLYQKLPYRKDLEIFYEDVKELLDKSHFAVYHKPSNYQEIVDRVKFLLNDNLGININEQN